MPMDKKEVAKLETRLQQANVIGRVVNSSEHINVPRFGKYLKDAYVFRKTNWSWNYIAPAIHENFGHIIDAIIKNNSRGVGKLSEVNTVTQI